MKITRASVLAATALAPAPLAYGADAVNLVWNGGFEESYTYWKNWGAGVNPYNQRTSAYGDINGIEARLEHWTGTGGIADISASSAPKPQDASLAVGNRYLTIYGTQYVE